MSSIPDRKRHMIPMAQMIFGDVFMQSSRRERIEAHGAHEQLNVNKLINNLQILGVTHRFFGTILLTHRGALT